MISDYYELDHNFPNSYVAVEIMAYVEFVRKIHSGVASAEDLYTIAPKGNHSKHQIAALKSFSVWGFYVTLFVLIALARSLVLK